MVKGDPDEMSDRKGEENRFPTWHDYETAFKKLKFRDAKSILTQAAKLADSGHTG